MPRWRAGAGGPEIEDGEQIVRGGVAGVEGGGPGGGGDGGIKLRGAIALAALGELLGQEVLEQRVVAVLAGLRLEEREGAGGLVLVALKDADGVGGEGERGIELMGAVEVSAGCLALRELHLEYAAGDEEGRGLAHAAEAAVEHVDADLKGGVIEGDGGEIQIVVDLVGRVEDGLPEEGDGLRRVAALLVDFGGEAEGGDLVGAMSRGARVWRASAPAPVRDSSRATS